MEMEHRVKEHKEKKKHKRHKSEKKSKHDGECEKSKIFSMRCDL